MSGTDRAARGVPAWIPQSIGSRPGGSTICIAMLACGSITVTMSVT
ncbi:MAG: hypothetical protein AAB011_02380 [Candidatus Eisenbacteria bacterium]